MSSILNYFPYEDPRAVQRQVLLQIEKEWHKYDVFVVVAPTAAGKSAISTTIARWAKNARITTPNNMLVEQYAEGFPDIPTLMGKENYATGLSYNNYAGRFYKSKIGICNNHVHATMVARNRHENAPTVFVADEAHNLLKFQQDFNALRYWKHKNEFPYGKEDKESLLNWLGTFKKLNQFQKALYKTLKAKNPEYIIEEDFSEWRGGGYDVNHQKLKRCKPGQAGTFQPQIKLTPIDVSRMTGVLWPNKTQKIVLLSATIGKKDVESLGLGKKRVRYLECKHPIPSEQRPIINDFVASLNHNNFVQGTVSMCNYIENSGMLEYHKGQKGLVHATYKQAELMSKHLKSRRFIFHTSENKQDMYQKFLDSKPEEGRILVASGMYEGLDLPEDLGRWQVLAKVPWPSLMDPSTAHQAKKDQEWYQWQTLKDVIQACGRICRTPTDFGVSYILDGSFERLSKSELTPQWFKDALRHY